MKVFQKKYHIPQLSLLGLMLLLLLTCCTKDGKQENVTKSSKKLSRVPIDVNLKQRLNEFAHKPRVSGCFGLYVYDLTAEQPVYAFNENEPIPSASCMKLLSGVAGYHLLGTDYKYITSIYIKGKISNGKLLGPIVFKGSSDPQFSVDDMKSLVKMLQINNVREIDGDILLDLAMNEPIQAETHWYPWDLERSKYGLLYQGAARVGTALVSSLKAQGIRLKNEKAEIGKLPHGAQRVSHFIRTIDRVVERMWKNSSNTRATAMLYTIGNHINAKDSAQKVGLAYLKHFLKNNIKENNPKIVVHDGCGLCRYNRLSARTLVDILKYGYADKRIYLKLRKYLSLSGVDGTSRRLLSGPDLNGKLRVKTGTLSHPYGISTLAGYCEAPNGHLLAFAIMDSEMSVLDAHVLQRNLCKVLVKDEK